MSGQILVVRSIYIIAPFKITRNVLWNILSESLTLMRIFLCRLVLWHYETALCCIVVGKTFYSQAYLHTSRMETAKRGYGPHYVACCNYFGFNDTAKIEVPGGRCRYCSW